jgi:hypothetical protein
LAKVPHLTEDRWKELHERLTLYAACKLVRRSWYGFRVTKKQGVTAVKGKGPEDIASDVIVAVLEGKRNWNEERYPDFLDFLTSVVDSMINALVRSKENRKTQRVEPVDDEDTEAEERAFVSREPSPDELVQDAEWQAKFREALVKELEDDSISLGLFDCLHSGFSDRSEIAELLGIGVNDVYNAQKRLERRIEAVMKKFDDGRRP